MKLYPFQEEGRDFLVGRRTALLADEMGLGKTAQAITAARELGVERVGVFCPASVRSAWREAFCRWWPGGPEPVVASYDQVRRGPRHQGGREFDLLILDESHFLKTPGAARTNRVYGRDGGWAHAAERVWALSGTPAPNNVSELWTLLRVLMGLDMTHAAFVERYCEVIPGDYGPRIVGAKNVEELRALLDGFMLRRRKAEVLPDLPPIRWDTVTLDCGEDLDVPECSAELVSAESEETHIATARRELGIKKIKPVARLIRDEVEGGLDKLVVFAYHRDVIWGLERALQKFNVGCVTLHGGHTDAQRNKAVAYFIQEPGCQVAIIQIDAGGVGLDGLQVASNVLFPEWSWTPATNVQAAMRCHRIGQNRGVLVRFAEMDAPLDRAITRTAARKAADLAPIFGTF